METRSTSTSALDVKAKEWSLRERLRQAVWDEVHCLDEWDSAFTCFTEAVPMVRALQLRCGHAFCACCVYGMQESEMNKSAGSITCPHCRAKCEPSDMVRALTLEKLLEDKLKVTKAKMAAMGLVEQLQELDEGRRRCLETIEAVEATRHCESQKATKRGRSKRRRSDTPTDSEASASRITPEIRLTRPTMPNPNLQSSRANRESGYSDSPTEEGSSSSEEGYSPNSASRLTRGDLYGPAGSL
ncbi:hypothetical protein P389DRAFT_42020 [Cystobasidium minutum MCA 4210]|uniref:uncharacterized protein n=1 Tax=Cystobasidium minutum MCA 4210 TaxID=1397322 RepID=UPI0034CFDED4|eukprot:jgi/Rhomi1/42020/CE42019_246